MTKNSIAHSMARVNDRQPPAAAAPPEDLDQLRADVAGAMVRLHRGLRSRAERLRTELAQVELELALSGTADPAPKPNGFREPIAFPGGPPALIGGQFVDGPQRPDGLIGHPLAAVREPAADVVDMGAPIAGDMELRGTAMAHVVEDLADDVRESILGDLEGTSIETVDDLVEFLSAGRSLEAIFIAEKDETFFRMALNRFFSSAGFAASNLSPDGVPKAWLAPAELAALEVVQEPPQPKMKTPKRDVARLGPGPPTRSPKELADNPLLVSWGAGMCLSPRDSREGWSLRVIREAVRLIEGEHRHGEDTVCCTECSRARHKSVEKCPMCITLSARTENIWREEKATPPPKSEKPKKPKPLADSSYSPADLIEACRSDSPHWVPLKSGADDRAIVEVIATIFRNRSLNPWGATYSIALSKKLGPQFWNTATGHKSKRPATLVGKPLTDAVRDLLEIPLPF